jgi:hypothetical protein
MNGKRDGRSKVAWITVELCGGLCPEPRRPAKYKLPKTLFHLTVPTWPLSHTHTHTHKHTHTHTHTHSNRPLCVLMWLKKRQSLNGATEFVAGFCHHQHSISSISRYSEFNNIISRGTPQNVLTFKWIPHIRKDWEPMLYDILKRETGAMWVMDQVLIPKMSEPERRKCCSDKTYAYQERLCGEATISHISTSTSEITLWPYDETHFLLFTSSQQPTKWN